MERYILSLEQSKALKIADRKEYPVYALVDYFAEHQKELSEVEMLELFDIKALEMNGQNVEIRISMYNNNGIE